MESKEAAEPTPKDDDDIVIDEPDKDGVQRFRVPTVGLKLNPDYKHPIGTKPKEKRMKPNIKSSLSLKEAFERFL